MLCEQFCLGQSTRRRVRQNKLHFADSKNHWGARSVIERKPSPAPRRSLKSLEAGFALYHPFRRHLPPRTEVPTPELASLMRIPQPAVRLKTKLGIGPHSTPLTKQQ